MLYHLQNASEMAAIPTGPETGRTRTVRFMAGDVRSSGICHAAVSGEVWALHVAYAGNFFPGAAV